MSFGCTSCGACCKRVDSVIEFYGEKEPGSIYHFPYAHKDGVCEKLGEDNRCTVYDNRPIICSIDAMMELAFMDDEAGKKEYYSQCADACNYMQEEDGIDKIFRVE